MKAAQEILDDMSPVHAGDLIPVLQNLQDAYGYLPKPLLECVAEQTQIPLSRIAGVVTFYEQFSLTPRGRHIVRVCRGTACHVRGAAAIARTVETLLGVSEGETTDDMAFTFHTAACLGTCFLAPVIMVDNNYYGQLTPESVATVLDSYRKQAS